MRGATRIAKTIVSKKDFSYKKGSCNLNFTLGTDNSSELKDFSSCLEEAMKDIEKILKGEKNGNI